MRFADATIPVMNSNGSFIHQQCYLSGLGPVPVSVINIHPLSLQLPRQSVHSLLIYPLTTLSDAELQDPPKILHLHLPVEAYFCGTNCLRSYKQSYFYLAQSSMPASLRLNILKRLNGPFFDSRSACRRLRHDKSASSQEAKKLSNSFKSRGRTLCLTALLSKAALSCLVKES